MSLSSILGLMSDKISLLVLAALFAPLAIGQQPSPQPTQVQAQPAPCVTTPTTPNPSGNGPTIKVPNKWRQMLDQQRQKIEAKTGIPMPDVATDIEQASKSKPAPCVPQTGSSKPVPPTPSPILKLPPDITTTTTLHCNPSSPLQEDGKRRSTTLTLPDPYNYASPKPTDVLVDSVVPDLAAHVPCYAVRVDIKTLKSFIQD